jgi:FkbM family methyltransferase
MWLDNIKDGLCEVLDTPLGPRLSPRNDDNAPNWHTGNYYHDQEISYLRGWLSAIKDPVFLDVGAHSGLIVMGVQDLCAKVHAWEPQRVVFNMLSGTIALNSWLHVWTYWCALGDRNGELPLPTFDYHKLTNFGGIEFGYGYQKYGIGREPLEWNGEMVALRTLDSYHFERADVVKVDVEGMEIEVLTGALQTIQRLRPKFLVEHDKTGKPAIHEFFAQVNYKCLEVGQGSDLACVPND